MVSVKRQANTQFLQSAQVKIARAIIMKLDPSNKKARYCKSLEELQDLCAMYTLSGENAIVDRNKYCLSMFLKKLTLPGNDKACREAAFKAFLDGEAQCKITNMVMRTTADSSSLVERVRKYIRLILGVYDLSELDFRERSCSTGASADLSYKKVNGRPWNKFGPVGVSPKVRRDLSSYNLEDRWADLSEILYAKIAYALKDKDSHRLILAHPTVDMVVQLGIGDMIRVRLKRFGIDLNDQTINQNLARISSIKRHLSTVDEKNASNSLAYWTVQKVLPPEWFLLLDAARTPYVCDPQTGYTHELEMFSAMGCGFTFELESLIFYAICLASCDPEQHSEISVYGDDIIVPSDRVHHVMQNLSYFGFASNVNKTFYGDNPFRESCGKHYLNGEDITPPRMRGVWSSIMDFYAFYNAAAMYPEIQSICLKYINSDYCFFGPPLSEAESDSPPWCVSYDESQYTYRPIKGLYKLGVVGHIRENLRSPSIHKLVKANKLEFYQGLDLVKPIIESEANNMLQYSLFRLDTRKGIEPGSEVTISGKRQVKRISDHIYHLF